MKHDQNIISYEMRVKFEDAESICLVLMREELNQGELNQAYDFVNSVVKGYDYLNTGECCNLSDVEALSEVVKAREWDRFVRFEEDEDYECLINNLIKPARKELINLLHEEEVTPSKSLNLFESLWNYYEARIVNSQLDDY